MLMLETLANVVFDCSSSGVPTETRKNREYSLSLRVITCYLTMVKHQTIVLGVPMQVRDYGKHSQKLADSYSDLDFQHWLHLHFKF